MRRVCRFLAGWIVLTGICGCGITIYQPTNGDSSSGLTCSPVDVVDDDDSLTGFGGGTLSNLQWNAGGYLEIASATNAWNLPDAASSTDWADMSGNVLLYHFNEAAWTGAAGEVLDASGGASHATAVAGASLTALGKLRGSATFDGVDDIVSIPPLATATVGDFTALLWFKVTAHNGAGRSYLADFRGDGAVANDSLALLFDDAGGGIEIRNAVSYTSGGFIELATPIRPAVGEWIHMAFSRSGTTFALTINGEDQPIILNGGSVAKNDAIVLNNGGRLGTYANYAGPGGNFIFNGQIDDFALFSRALSLSDIQRIHRRQAPTYAGIIESRTTTVSTAQHWNTLAWTPTAPYGKPLPTGAAAETAYASGNVDMTDNVLYLKMEDATWVNAAQEVTDSSGSGNHGTAVAGAVLSTNGRLGQSGGFDGVDDHLLIPNSPSLDVTGTDATFSAWVYVRNPNGATVPIIHKESQYTFAIFPTLELTFADTANWSYVNTGPHGQLLARRWHHVAVTTDATGYDFYLDGAFTSHFNTGTGMGSTLSALSIGCYNGVAPCLDAFIDEVAIWSRKLGVAEIAALHARGVTNLLVQANVGAGFVGSTGSPLDFFSELLSGALTPPTFTPGAGSATGASFRYRAALESDSASALPRLPAVEWGPSANFCQ